MKQSFHTLYHVIEMLKHIYMLIHTTNYGKEFYSCSSSSPSSSNCSSSSTVASWYCWYSEIRSFMLDSASVNSISSMPSPVYQCKNAFLLKSSWMAVELPIKVEAILRPLGGMSQTAVLML